MYTLPYKDMEVVPNRPKEQLLADGPTYRWMEQLTKLWRDSWVHFLCFILKCSMVRKEFNDILQSRISLWDIFVGFDS